MFWKKIMMKIVRESPDLSTRPIDILKQLQFYSKILKTITPPKSTMKYIRESPDLSASPIDILNKLHTCQTHPKIQLMDLMWPSFGNVPLKESRRGYTRSRNNNALYAACDTPMVRP